jgi:hypothetical protein
LVTSAGGSHFSQTDLEALAAIQVIGTGVIEVQLKVLVAALKVPVLSRVEKSMHEC